MEHGEKSDRPAQWKVFSAEDTRELLLFLTEIFDVARLVEPTHTAIISIGADGMLQSEPYTCFKVWGKDTRCENCTSICAMRDECKMTKYEFIKNDIFYVVSNPIAVTDAAGEKHKLVLELVSHVSDHLSLGQVGEKTIGEIIEETQRKIYSDELTGAYNRRYLSELLFSHHGQTDVASRLGVVVVDLKNFKSINDRYGHLEGDRVLAQTAQKLRSVVRGSDSVVRMGGDEFVVTLTDCGEQQVRNAIDRMRRAINSIRVGEMLEEVTADMGYAYAAQFDATSTSLEALLKRADEAMYKEKTGL